LLSGTKETVTSIQNEITKHLKFKVNSPKYFSGVIISASIPRQTSLSINQKIITSHDVPLLTYSITTPGKTDVKIIRCINPIPKDTYRSKVGSIN
jgi:hypothetical protein